ncbi:MAG: CBS domain-containing protein [Rhodospirillales bacterium]|nr:CBS domain-containing protein [Rhodospirillales bacterium]MCB9995771.1 CBS domain-containing protein [Rhodospirillales bacterium]
MPCIDAIDKKALTFKEDVSVEDAVAKLKKAKAGAAVVLDKDGKAAGTISFKGLISNLMPVSIAIGGGSVSLDAAPGVGKRLLKLYPLTVGEIMERQMYKVAPAARLIEAMRSMMEHAAPAVIVENDDGEYLGIITETSIIERLEAASQE